MTRLITLPLLALTLLGGCDEQTDLDEAAFLVAEALAPPPTLTSSGGCPGTVTFTLSGVTPGGNWALAISPNLIPGMPVPGGVCAGAPMRIGPPAFLGATGTASSAGTGSYSVSLGAGACSWWVQPFDLTDCMGGVPIQP